MLLNKSPRKVAEQTKNSPTPIKRLQSYGIMKTTIFSNK